MSKMKVLDGTHIYENGKDLGPLVLTEGTKSDKLVIIESFSGSWCDLKQVPLDENEKSLVEATASQSILLVLQGRFQASDTINANKRIYPNSLWNKIFADQELQRKLASGECLGECDHPKDGETLLSRVACMTTRLWRNENDNKEIFGRMVIFNTAAGKNLLAIHEGGGRIGVSSRGSGSVVRQDGVDIVQDDYEFETFDAVHNPSTPGAYPTVMSESTESKETPMARLQDLADRFNRCQKRDVSTLSEDAISLIREDVASIRASLLSENYGTDAPKAAALIAEVVTYQGQLPKIVEKTVEPPKVEAEIVEKTQPAKFVKESKRAESIEQTVEILKSVYEGKTTDIREATKIAREAYRNAVKLEGPLGRHELDGISKFVQEATKPVAKAMENKAKIMYKLTVTEDGKKSERIFTTEKELREEIDKLNAKIVVEVDPSEAIYEECAKKFEPLLESQTAKSINAINEIAKVRSSSSALSAKVTAAVQVIESLVSRTNKAEAISKDVADDFAAAIKVLEAVADEAGVERMRGAVHAIAATHPHIPGLVESLAKTNSLMEAIRVTKKLTLDGLPEITREPIGSTRRFEEAIEKSTEAEKIVEATYSDKRKDGQADLSNRVVALMRERGIGK